MAAGLWDRNALLLDSTVPGAEYAAATNKDESAMCAPLVMASSHQADLRKQMQRIIQLERRKQVKTTSSLFV